MQVEKIYLEEATRRLIYNPNTGIFKWKRRDVEHFTDIKWNAVRGCSIAGNIVNGHLEIKIEVNGITKAILGQNLAWFMYYGKVVDYMLEHIDKDTTNNKIDNLTDIPYTPAQKDKFMCNDYWAQCILTTRKIIGESSETG